MSAKASTRRSRAFRINLRPRGVAARETRRASSASVQLLASPCSTSPLTIRLGKKAFYEQLGRSEEAAYEEAVAVMTENALAHDAQEGKAAFLQKRRPIWKGD